MKNELRITFDSNDNCEVEIHGLSGAKLIMAINELIIRTKKISEECGVSKDSTIFNRIYNCYLISIKVNTYVGT